MTSIATIASHIATSGAVAGIDLISSANAKGLGALLEDKRRPAGEIYKQILHDEALEPMWETFFCSILTKIAKTITPNVPEQITMIPGKLLGAAWHWGITSHQSTNKTAIVADAEKDQGVGAAFYNAFVKGPSELALKLTGLGEGDSNFLKFGLSQLGIFSLLSFGLRNTEENLPGVNLDSDDSFTKSLLKGAGYTVVEQATYIASQAIRYYTDFYDEFKQNNNSKTSIIAKSLANVINERFFPGHILSGIAASMSTWYFGKSMPRVTAAAIGEFPTMLLNRVMNCHRRRATKEIYDGESKSIVANYRFNDTGFKNFLSTCDTMFDTLRNKLIGVVSSIFDVSLKELQDSLNISPKILVDQCMARQSEQVKAVIDQSNRSETDTTVKQTATAGLA